MYKLNKIKILIIPDIKHDSAPYNLKQACCTGFRADPSNATPPVGKNHLLSKIAVTCEQIQGFRCPSRFIFSEKNVNIVCFMTGSMIVNRSGVTAL